MRRFIPTARMPGERRAMGWFGNLKIWQKTLAPLAILAVSAIFLTLMMSMRMGTIGDGYSLLLSQQARAALEAVRSDTNTSDLGAEAYQLIAETDVPRMQDLLKQLDATKAEYHGHLDKVRQSFADDSGLVGTMRNLGDMFDRAFEAAVPAEPQEHDGGERSGAENHARGVRTGQ